MIASIPRIQVCDLSRPVKSMQVCYCKGKYLSIMPVNQLQRQQGVRFFSPRYYTQPGVGILAWKNMLVMN